MSEAEHIRSLARSLTGAPLRILGETLDHLISRDYVSQNAHLHETTTFGKSGWRHAVTVAAFARELSATSILDYGCGRGSLKKAMKSSAVRDVREYDPAIKGKNRLPVPADLVVCTDVLEHIEPDKLVNVINHLASLSRLGCFAIVATRPAWKMLPDGRNAHLIIESAEWWLEQMVRPSWQLDQHVFVTKKDGVNPHEVRMWFKTND